MKKSFVVSVLLSLAFVVGCSSPAAEMPDAAVQPDTGPVGIDAGPIEVDAAMPEDAAVVVDAFTPPDAADYDGGPPATWDEVYALFDTTHCGGGTTGCHYSTSRPSGSLSLATSATACTQLLHAGRSPSCSISQRVTPGDLNASLLYRKLQGAVIGCGDRMPDGRTPFTPEELSVVGRWILAGAICP
jgi:hypothetical protein